MDCCLLFVIPRAGLRGLLFYLVWVLSCLFGFNTVIKLVYWWFGGFAGVGCFVVWGIDCCFLRLLLVVLLAEVVRFGCRVVLQRWFACWVCLGGWQWFVVVRFGF